MCAEMVPSIWELFACGSVIPWVEEVFSLAWLAVGEGPYVSMLASEALLATELSS